MSKQIDDNEPQPVPRQLDLFGVIDKQQRMVDEVIARNKADNQAGIKPIPRPLFIDEEKD